jgi:carboxyl-terminal processing protease
VSKLEDRYTGFKSNVHKFSLGRVVAAAFIGLFIFSVGVAVGDGRLSFSSHSSNPNLPAQLDYSSVNTVYNALRQKYDGKLTTEELLNGLKAGLARAADDPYTEYFTADQARQFNNALNNSYSGIGAELGQDKDKNLIVVAPIKGFAAEKAGLKAQDFITTIDGESTSGMSVDAAVNKIRGKKDTKVTLKVIRNKSENMTFTITRTDIHLPSVTTKILPGNIGYMEISTFADDTAGLARKAAAEFKSKHVNGIVLDLRDNPGGRVDAATAVSSLWLPDGTLIMQEKRASGEVMQTYTASGTSPLHDIPTVVLLNGGSASASEITAGALHDNKGATLVGEKSYGKGVVQGIQDFSDGSQLKVTIASWYRPNGQNINHKGITPDKIVKLNEADAKAGTDTQQTAATEYLKSH